MTGFLFPNEGIIEWDLLIVIYPYITGLVAGAFIVSSLYHVFGITSLKPVARFSLITALAFLLVTPMPLAIHLGRPDGAGVVRIVRKATGHQQAAQIRVSHPELIVLGEV